MDINNYLTMEEQEKVLLGIICGQDIQLSSAQRSLKKAFSDGFTLTAPVLAAMLYKVNSSSLMMAYLPHLTRFTEAAVKLLRTHLAEEKNLSRAVGIVLGTIMYQSGEGMTKSINYPLAYALSPEAARKHLAGIGDWKALCRLGEEEFVRQSAPSDVLKELGFAAE